MAIGSYKILEMSIIVSIERHEPRVLIIFTHQ